MDRVSIVVPTWNRRALLEDLLQRIDRQTLRPAEVIVVDNGSEDGSAEAAERAGARVIRLERNLGFAAAVNRGVESCGNEWAAVVNNDVEPREDWLERLLEGARGGDAWFATGKLLREDDPATIDGAWDEIARSGCAERCGSGLTDGPLWNMGRAIRFAPFTAVLCRRRLFAGGGRARRAVRIVFGRRRFRPALRDARAGRRLCSGGRGAASRQRDAGQMARRDGAADRPESIAPGGQALPAGLVPALRLGGGGGAGLVGRGGHAPRRGGSVRQRKMGGRPGLSGDAPDSGASERTRIDSQDTRGKRGGNP